MSDTEFDTALVTAAFRLGGETGWRNVTVAAAARAGGLPMAEARERFPTKLCILTRFGRLADQAALIDVTEEGTTRDRLFDLLMRRFDVLQSNRAGVKALLRTLPGDPPTAALVACATRRSMKWMLQAAGVSTAGLRGELKIRGLIAVWLWGVRAWERDESEDLSGTMAAIDHALERAEQAVSWLHGPSRPKKPEPTAVEATEGGTEPEPPSAEPPAPDGSEPETPSTDAPSTDAPSTVAPSTVAPSTAAPPAGGSEPEAPSTTPPPEA